MSDKLLTGRFQFWKRVPCDIVVANSALAIAEMVALSGGVLHIPAFTKNKTQLTAAEVHGTRKTANIHNHVERVIGNVRQKFSLLQGTVAIDYLQASADDKYPLFDRIVCMCCALPNVFKSVIVPLQ